jgi:hypothetical protein
MRAMSAAGLLAGVVSVGLIAGAALSASQAAKPWPFALDEHPSIQYALRPTTDRVAALNQALVQGTKTLQRDARTGYLLPVLDALHIGVDSQILVFSKTGVQGAYTSPRNPRALYFDRSVIVGYVSGAPVLEVAAHDPQQGVVFYMVDQRAEKPSFIRGRSCLSCHVSASTLDVPGLIVRSNVVADDGNVIPQMGSNDVDHRTSHPERWGGYYVTADLPAGTYNQRGHLGNITFSGHEVTSNLVFVEWLNSAPETRGYPSESSDIVTLLVFDHQMHAINLLTKLNWQARVVASDGVAPLLDGAVRQLVNDLGDYLLFAGEAPLPVALTPQPAFAHRFEAAVPKDRRGRSFGELELRRRLLRYPCSYMVYSEAFDALPADIRQAVYHRMLDVLTGGDRRKDFAQLSADDRRAIVEILKETKSDFPATP